MEKYNNDFRFLQSFCKTYVKINIRSSKKKKLVAM